jgi:hypothetical protein
MTAHTPRSPHRRPSSIGIIEEALRRNDDQPHSAPGARMPTPAHSEGVSRPSHIRLLDADPDLAEAVPPADIDRARRVLRATVSHHDLGPVTLPEPATTAFALLIVAGAATAEVRLTPAARMVELLLPGDIVSPRPASFCLPDHGLSLTALPPGLSFAVLDHRFVEAATVWPGLMTAIHQRLHDQAHRLAVHSAICQLPRIEERIIAMLSHLAGRIGKVTPDGVVVPLALRHEDLAGYVGARRPSVSLAIKMLRAQGRLDRRADETWLLPPESVRPEIED